MSSPDPLAEVMEAARTGTGTGEDGSTYVYFNDGAHLANVARDFFVKALLDLRDQAAAADEALGSEDHEHYFYYLRGLVDALNIVNNGRRQEETP